jgi:threonine synthase
VHCLPVGNAGNITAYWRGYREYFEAGLATRTPRMFGFQASGAAPIVRGEPVLAPMTIATAIRIGNPASWRLAEQARDESGGLIGSVTDRQILAAYRMLAGKEAVFGELASAAGVAGLLQAREQDQVAPGSRVVCTVTGNGLKAPDWAVSAAQARENGQLDAGCRVVCTITGNGLKDPDWAVSAAPAPLTVAADPGAAAAALGLA